MGESGFSYVAICERKLEIDSSKPELEPGLLPVLGRPLDVSDWWLDPGRDVLLPGREGGLPLAGS